ncbi:mgl-2 [Pristionchus pacificus]|nr:mgl-2 [Pristionchus pacificus]
MECLEEVSFLFFLLLILIFHLPSLLSSFLLYLKMLYSHVGLLMVRVLDVVAKTTVQQSARMLVAEIPGDIQIGALFSLHHQKSGVEGCGSIWEQYGIQRTEMALKAVREWNRVLPFKLGISIRDSCWTERIAMEQTIAFLREGVAQCSCCQTPGCEKKRSPVVAVIGPAKSSGTIAVQNLLQVFRIPQIGYSSTSTDLTDKEQFGFFLRVVPSDAWQAQAITKLLLHFDWTYIAVIYSAGNYGEKGFEQLQKLLEGSIVCIAHNEKIKPLATEEEYDKVLEGLARSKSRPNVIVCFCEGMTMRGMFFAQKRLGEKIIGFQRFQWIGSDGWADREDVVEGIEEMAIGSLSIRIHSPNVPAFEDYYHALTPENNTANPWFREFWEFKFNCSFTIPKEEKKSDRRLCSGKEDLSIGYKQDAKLTHVNNSIAVVATALKAMYEDKCKDNSTLCTESLSRNGTLLYKYLLNVTYVDEFGQEIQFDENGEPPAWYDILNYQGFVDRVHQFQQVGHYLRQWNGKEHLNITSQTIMFRARNNTAPTSVCSEPCRVGQKKRQTTACCWICETCRDHQYVNYSTNMCVNCTIGYWPDDNRTGCVQIGRETLSWQSIEVIVALLFAILGIITTIFTILVFVKHNSTPVVKSTTRELSYIILCGIIASYAVTFAILSTPSFWTCFLTRTIPPVAFSIVYSALLTKTNRIARILAGSKKRILTKKPRFLSTFSQVVITWILVGIQCLIVAMGVYQEMPYADHDVNFLPRRIVLVCQSSTVAFMTPFLWNFFLISLCTLYAVKTRNLPENFNEAKFIGFTMYCTLVVWCAFIVIHLGTLYKALTMSFSFSLSASIALVLLFFPKLYIIIVHPEKNVRASYTTTKLIRCHFGNSQSAYDSKAVSGVSGKTTRTSTQSTRAPSFRSTGVTRTASVHVVSGASTTIPPTIETGTQTEMEGGRSSIPSLQGGRFARTFSMGVGGGRKRPVDEDVQQLVDACRRYQLGANPNEDERLQTAQNLLLEESEEDEDEVGALLAGSIENSMRTVLQTVAPRAVPSRTPPSKRGDNDEDGFEELLRSRGVNPLNLSNATSL